MSLGEPREWSPPVISSTSSARLGCSGSRMRPVGAHLAMWVPRSSSAVPISDRPFHSQLSLCHSFSIKNIKLAVRCWSTALPVPPSHRTPHHTYHGDLCSICRRSHYRLLPQASYLVHDRGQDDGRQDVHRFETLLRGSDPLLTAHTCVVH